MKKQFFNLLIIISLFISAAAQTARQISSAATEKNLRAHVAYLASDKLDGRRTGETGATYAAGYIENMFSIFKLKAGVSQAANGKAKTNFLQSFPFVTGVEMAETGNAFSIGANKTGEQDSAYKTGIDFSPVGFSPNAQIGNTEVVFAGYGVASSELNYDNYKNLNVSGRIVLAFDGTPENDNPHSQFGRFDARAKARIAKERGAIGLILISREASLTNDKLAQLKINQTLGEAALPTIVVSRRTGANFLGIDEALLKGVEENFAATAKAIGVINSQPPVNLRATAAIKVNLNKKQSEAYNVIGILEGTDPILRNEAIVIGAHYDHLGKGGAGSLAENSSEIHGGADDNASGVAGMLELARQFSQERKNKRTLIFIAFGGEEEGLLGSNFYVNNPVFPLAKTAAMINMDMIGRLKDGKLTIGGIGTASEWKSSIEYRNLQQNDFTNSASLNIPLPKIPMESQANSVTAASMVKTPLFNLQLNEDGFGPSDHSSFYGRQIPVLFFFTGTHTDYHKPSDTAEKINYEGLLKITNFVAEIIKSIDQNATRPTYAVAKNSGMMGARIGFNVSLGTIPSYAESSDGLVLDGVRESSPASKAGLKAGDKIVKLAGKDVRNISDYTFVLGEMKANVEYEIEIVRGKERLNLKIVPAARK